MVNMASLTSIDWIPNSGIASIAFARQSVDEYGEDGEGNKAEIPHTEDK